jgi:hypothetical protein
MKATNFRELSLEETRSLYKKYMKEHNIAPVTIATSCTDAFYLWRKSGKEVFWNIVLSINFEKLAKDELIKILSENPDRDINNSLSSYLSQVRKFRRYYNKSKIMNKPKKKRKIFTDIPVPTPSIEQVELYLRKWDDTEDYRLQEKALEKLFFELCPKNTCISDVLLKASTLNDFYSTNIFSIYPVAEHICSLNIDSRLKSNDATLVKDIQNVTIHNKEKNFYSFATKYCSHHNPLNYPIYDSYVDKILRYFQKHDSFSNFSTKDLRDYVEFKRVLMDFSKYYGLDKYNLRQIDKYIWQLGKEYFPNDYGKNKKDKPTI